jgi:hypothetical protein
MEGGGSLHRRKGTQETNQGGTFSPPFSPGKAPVSAFVRAGTRGYRLEASLRNARLSKETGGPGEIRTHDLCLRRAALYPAELRVRDIADLTARRCLGARSGVSPTKVTPG